MVRPMVLFYDSNCFLCHTWKQWIELGSSGESIVFADANDKKLARSLGIDDLERLDRQMCLLYVDGRAAWGYDALAAVVERLPGTSMVGQLMWAGPVRRLGHWVYAQVARRRACAAGPTSRQPGFNVRP